MVNRKLAIFFVLLANIILLAHAIVPHHHHHEQICFQGSLCNSNVPHTHHTNFPVHEHDGNKTNTCILQQTFTLPVNSGKYDSDCDLNCATNHLPNYLFAVLFCHDEQPDPEIGITPMPPETFSVWHDFIPTSSGLRAPPTV